MAILDLFIQLELLKKERNEVILALYYQTSLEKMLALS